MCNCPSKKGGYLLVENQRVEIKWVPSNKSWYENLGYHFTEFFDTFSVRVEDLTLKSPIKVKIICDNCGVEYEKPYSTYYNCLHSKTSNGKCLCPKCMRHLISVNIHKDKISERQDKYYSALMKVAEETGYTIITPKEDIKTIETRIEYICPSHGKHSMRVDNMIYGKRCPDCAKDKVAELYKRDCDTIIKKVSELGGHLLNPQDYKNSRTKNLLITCLSCGQVFLTSFLNFTQHGGQLCDKCQPKMSYGASRVKSWLDSNHVEYVQEKWFQDCKDINPLPFDFYLPKYNTIIEYDGIQHFKDLSETLYNHMPLEETKRHDSIKNEYCKNKNIKLIRIPYWEKNNIDDILDKQLHKDIV